MPEARTELLPLLEEGEDASPHAGCARSSPRSGARPTAAETLMPELEDDGERGLLAGLLVDDREWPDLSAQIDEWRRRLRSAWRKRRVHQVTRAIRRGADGRRSFRADAGGPGLESLQREAQAVRDLTSTRPPPSPSDEEHSTGRQHARQTNPSSKSSTKLIATGKQKGFLTYDEVNDALPAEIVSLDQLDDIMMMFNSMDIEVVDGNKTGRVPAEIEAPPAESDDEEPAADPIDLTPGPVGRTEDPVRLYLREMGRVALLTREGEITLAKRIEEGKDEVTRAILSTNLALEKIHVLRDELRRELMPIKDVVDYPEEEFTEEKEEDLRRHVIRELGNVDRLLRERDRLHEEIKRVRARVNGKKKGKGEPPWKKLDTQATAKQARVLQILRSLTLQPSLLETWGQDPRSSWSGSTAPSARSASGRTGGARRRRRWTRSWPRSATTTATTATATSTRRRPAGSRASRTAWCGWPSRRSAAPRITRRPGPRTSRRSSR